MIYIGSDHAGYDLKKEIISYVKEELKKDIEDVGCFSKESVDYPDIAVNASKKIVDNNGIGILICGAGIGISITANKIKGIRCAVCSEEYTARMARKHNDANALALGARVIGVDLAKSIVNVFLSTAFDGGRHGIRVNKIKKLEE